MPSWKLSSNPLDALTEGRRATRRERKQWLKEVGSESGEQCHSERVQIEKKNRRRCGERWFWGSSIGSWKRDQGQWWNFPKTSSWDSTFNDLLLSFKNKLEIDNGDRYTDGFPLNYFIFNRNFMVQLRSKTGWQTAMANILTKLLRISVGKQKVCLLEKSRGKKTKGSEQKIPTCGSCAAILPAASFIEVVKAKWIILTK